MRALAAAVGLVVASLELVGCSGQSCGVPRLLLLRVTDGTTGGELPNAQVMVNGRTLPLPNDGDVCANPTLTFECTHGIGLAVPSDFDRTKLEIDVALAGYAPASFTVTPAKRPDGQSETEARVVTIFESGSAGMAAIGNNEWVASGTCD